MLLEVLAGLAYIVIGVVAGVLSGMLGIGGGIVTVPCLLFLFHWLGFPQAYVMHMAIATSLAAMVLNTLSGTLAHQKRGSVRWDVFKKMTPGLFIGGIIGVVITAWLSGVVLEIVFGVFLLLLAVHFWRSKSLKDAELKLPKTHHLFLLSAGVASISNILGIGGGVLTVPLLHAFNMPGKQAIGTSCAVSLWITFFGSLCYLFIGWGVSETPQNIGYVNLPAFAVVGVATFFAAPYGAKLAHELPEKRVRKVFASVLLITALTLLF